MLIPVLIVSSLVHIYSIGYMSHDPHNQRFFSYLSLFTFMMIILVTANNYLLMFVGCFSALYILKYISFSALNCWDILTTKFKTISRESFFKAPSETKQGLPSYICVNILDCMGNVIVQCVM